VAFVVMSHKPKKLFFFFQMIFFTAGVVIISGFVGFMAIALLEGKHCQLKISQEMSYRL